MAARSNVRRATQARHDEMVALLRTGVDDVATLAARFGVSPSTVRRDLAQLAGQGRIARTYGGALVRDVFHERSFAESEGLNLDAKETIAATAAGLVPDEGVVFVDAGTTCLALARLLVTRGPLTVVTRGLEAALLLARAPEIDVILTGGRVQPLSHGAIGPLASLALERLRFDVAFLGADAVDPVRGLGEPTVEETRVKEEAAQQAGEVVLLVDGSKFGQHAPAWVPLDPGWTVVTDESAPEDAVAHLAGSGVQVRRA